MLSKNGLLLNASDTHPDSVFGVGGEVGKLILSLSGLGGTIGRL